MRDITLQTLQHYYSLILKVQKVKTVKKHHVIISGALKEAVVDGIISSSPATYVEFPGEPRFEGAAYSPAQAKTLLSVLDSEPIKPAVILGLYYGLRRSEVCGLRWEDVDFSNNRIRIRNTVTRNGSCVIEGEFTKSAAGQRDLALIPETVDYLNELKQIHEQSGFESDKVCTRSNGVAFTPDYVSHSFLALIRKHGLPRIRFHDLRHTAGSILIQGGVDAKQVQQMLGHADISTTYNVYIHLADITKENTASVMGGLLKSS